MCRDEERSNKLETHVVGDPWLLWVLEHGYDILIQT